jgi:hypothetical protein
MHGNGAKMAYAPSLCVDFIVDLIVRTSLCWEPPRYLDKCTVVTLKYHKSAGRIILELGFTIRGNDQYMVKLLVDATTRML